MASSTFNPQDSQHNSLQDVLLTAEVPASSMLDAHQDAASPSLLYINHTIFVGYSEKDIFPILNHDDRCLTVLEQNLGNLPAVRQQNSERALVMIAKENIAFPRHAIYIVQDDKDIAIIQEMMARNNEEGTWYTVPKVTVDLMLQNYEEQVKSCCDKGAGVSYPVGFSLALATQIAIFKMVADLTGDVRIAAGVTTLIALGAMFYMKAAYSNNLCNQKRVEFNPGTRDAQSIFVNPISLADFDAKNRSQILFAIGAPLAAMSISAAVGLSVTRMSGQLGVGFAAVALKTIEDLLTNALRAVEQLRLLHPAMGPAHEFPGLGALYRSRVGQVMQKGFVGATPGLVSATYAYAAFSALKVFEENPKFYLKACLGLFGLASSLATVPLYSLYELGAAERSLARTGNPLADNSKLRFFQNLGKKQSKNASDSLAKKSAYTLFHIAAQGPAIGVGADELIMAFLPELTTMTKGGILIAGMAISLMFSLSKNKRVFEQPEKEEDRVLPAPAGMSNR